MVIYNYKKGPVFTMSKRNHYPEAKLPPYMRPVLLRDLEYDAPVYVTPGYEEDWRDEGGGLIVGFYSSTDRIDSRNTGRLWADGRMELEKDAYEPQMVTGRVGLMLVMVVDGYSEKDVLLADLRFMDGSPSLIDISRPSGQENEDEWFDVTDNAIPVEAFIAHEESGREAYFGPSGYKGDLKRLRKFGDRLLTMSRHRAEADSNQEDREVKVKAVNPADS